MFFKARFTLFGNISLVVAGLLAVVKPASAGGLNWPADRLLPAFPAPAPVIECINTAQASDAEEDMFASLEGIVNRAQPRIACIDRRSGEDQLAWLKIHKLPHRFVDGLSEVARFKNEITGLVVTDPDQPDTLNLATTLAGLNDELICAPELLEMLTNAPCFFQIKDDLRGRFTGSSQVYEYVRTNCWPRCTHQVIAGLSGNMHANLRDYLIAIKSAVVWFNPASDADATGLQGFFSGMQPANSVYLGWWPDEAQGLEFCGRYGIPVMASDFFNNGSVFSGVAEPVSAPAIPPAPPLENKIYLAMIISDGDNVQYMQHAMKQNWKSPARGSVPIGWTVSPLAADLDPAMLNFYYRTATTNDCLVSGPSGAGYTRLNFWNTNFVPAYTRNTDRYLRRSGIRIITVWNEVTDVIADSFASNCPTLLGITSQEGGRYVAVHGNLPVIGFPRRAAYADNVSQLQEAIAAASKKWNGTSPMFVALQANAWNVGPTDFQNIAAALDKNKFTVVRPDHLFMLLKQSLAAGQTTPSVH